MIHDQVGSNHVKSCDLNQLQIDCTQMQGDLHQITGDWILLNAKNFQDQLIVSIKWGN